MTAHTPTRLTGPDQARQILEVDPTTFPHARIWPDDHYMIAGIATAAATDDHRAILKGLHTADGTTIATDSYRMHWTNNLSGPLTTVLEGRTIDAHALRQFIGPKPTNNKTITIIATPNGGIVAERSTTGKNGKTDWIHLPAIEGKYPSAMQLIPNPDTCDGTLTLTPEHWTAPLTAADKATNTTKTMHPVQLTPETGTINQDGWQMTLHLPTTTTNGQPIAAAFNPRYLLEAIQAAAGPHTLADLTIRHRGELKPIAIEGPNNNALLMPIRV